MNSFESFSTTQLSFLRDKMVTTRSQANAKRAASAAASANPQKKAKFIVMNTPSAIYSDGNHIVKIYNIGDVLNTKMESQKQEQNVKVYKSAADFIDAYDAYDTYVAEKQEKEQFVRSPIMTRSKTKKLDQQKKVDAWKDECDNCIHNLKHAPTAKDRRDYWVSTIKYLLDEQVSQKGENCVEYKTIITTQIYKVLSYMFNNYYMDFKPHHKYWRVVEEKAKELLIDIERQKKKGKLTDETYVAARKVIQEAQTFQIMYDKLVFSK